MSRSHSHGGAICDFTTKKACALARKVALGQCAEMIDDKAGPYPCTHWAVEKVAERGYCGTHIGAVVRAEDERLRAAKKRAELDGRIDAFMAWEAEHPSVHDRMPTTS